MATFRQRLEAVRDDPTQPDFYRAWADLEIRAVDAQIEALSRFIQPVVMPQANYSDKRASLERKKQKSLLETRESEPRAECRPVCAYSSVYVVERYLVIDKNGRQRYETVVTKIY